MTDSIDATRLSKSTFNFSWFFDSPKRWYYNSEWGIMHATGCVICANHFRHIPGDTDVDESYRCAKQQRDAEFEKCYSEGYRAGRTAQKAHDKKRLKSYSSRLTAARAQISLLEARHDKLEKAGLQLEAVLNVFETAWNELKYEGLELKHVNSSLRADDCDNWILGSDNDSVSEDDDDNDDDCDYEDGKDGQGDEGSDGEHDDQTEEDDGQGREEEEKEDYAPFPSDSGTNGREEGEDYDRLEGSSNTEDDTGDNESKETPTNHPLNRSSPTSPLAVNDNLFAARQQATDTRPLHQSVQISMSTSHSTLVSPPDSDSNSTVKFVTALKEIRRKTMITHFPGQKEGSAEIKSLVSETHRTPCWQRTGVQNVFLSEWRRPSPAPPLAIDESLGRGEINVYVDASKVGIGFYSEGRWQAWRLKEGWKEAKTRDVQWAEAVAVEMGIRLLLEDSASYRGKKIRLYSDNEDVVKAISAEDFYRVQVGRTVRIFQDICLFNGLDCTTRWIRGSKNPADAPSRLVTSLEKHQRFPRDVIIPPRLRDFVLPYHLST